MVYVGGVELPLVELFLGIGVISIIILIELIVIMILISFHMKNSKRLEEEMGKLTHILLTIQGKEYDELARLKELEGKQENMLSKFSGKKTVKHHKKPDIEEQIEKTSAELLKQADKEKKKEDKKHVSLLKRIDSFFRGKNRK